MKSVCAGLLVVAVALGVSSQAVAKDEPEGRQVTSVGVGAALGAEYVLTGETWLAMMTVYVPIELGKYFRLEPDFGLGHLTEDSGTDYEKSSTAIRFGIGAMYAWDRGKVGLYAGMRFSLRIGVDKEQTTLVPFSSDSESETKEVTHTSLGINLEPCVGAHYFFSPHFSLGGELQLPIRFLNVYEAWDGEESEDAGMEVAVSTVVLMTLRWFF
jgi:hypothetical protein